MMDLLWRADTIPITLPDEINEVEEHNACIGKSWVPVTEEWLAALDDFRNWLIREAA